MNRKHTTGLLLLALAMLAWPSALEACAVCFGEPDSPMTKGLRWGIASLVLILVPVLGGVGGFFIFLCRRGKAYAQFEEHEVLKE